MFSYLCTINNNKTIIMETATAKRPLQAIDYLTCTKELLAMGFKSREISKAIKQAGQSVESLTEIKGYQDLPRWKGTFEVVSERHSYRTKEYRGAYHRDVDKVGYGIRQSAQYQGLKHGKIVFELLKNRFWWFDKFVKEVVEVEYPLKGCTRIENMHPDFDNYTVAEIKKLSKGKEVVNTKSLWSLYEIYREDAEIYLATGEGSLYVPIKALLSGDWNAIVERMTSYHNGYFDPENLSGYALNHRGRTKEEYAKDQKEAYENSLKPLNSVIGQSLKFYMTHQENENPEQKLFDYSIGMKDITDTAREGYSKGKFKLVSMVEFYHMPEDTQYLNFREDKATGLPIVEGRKGYTFQGQALDSFNPHKLLSNIWVLVKKGKKIK